MFGSASGFTTAATLVAGHGDHDYPDAHDERDKGEIGHTHVYGIVV